MTSLTNKLNPVSPKRKWKFRGIQADAKAIGCSRTILFAVLSGKRPDLKGVANRYAELKEKQKQEKQTTL